jgi:hypothetical protein
MRTRLLPVSVCVLVGALALPGLAAALKSGPQPGQRPLPFTSNAITGEHRGQQHCYICELKDEPAILIFARKQDAPTARLLRDLRDALREHSDKKLFGWLVFLANPDPSADTGAQTSGASAMERSALEFARRNNATTLPLTVLDDPQGPPGYRIAPDAAVTLLFFRRGKIVANRAYRDREWTMEAAGSALRDLRVLLAAPATP